MRSSTRCFLFQLIFHLTVFLSLSSASERDCVAFDRTQDCLRLFHSIFERDRILNFKSALLACSMILHLNVKERGENEEMIV